MAGNNKNGIEIRVGTGGDEGKEEFLRLQEERGRESSEKLRLERNSRGPTREPYKVSWLSTFLWLLRRLVLCAFGILENTSTSVLAVSEGNTLLHIFCPRPSSPSICLNDEELTSTASTMDLVLQTSNLRNFLT
ncbi:hypothetical protein NE237_020315 [Protea cynaroides]|uniref:Uncharacterized protein n=1 Tax=Protea cynaroides TaxID=273540 RepID=A0A9Q0H702_9MAGN|nr:hypothetical protein NE237_020315 [Protea cynaroides]